MAMPRRRCRGFSFLPGPPVQVIQEKGQAADGKGTGLMRSLPLLLTGLAYAQNTSWLVSDAFDTCGPISLTRAGRPLASVGISGVCSEELGNHPRLARTVPFQVRRVSKFRGRLSRVEESL